MLVDTHAHLSDLKFDEDLDLVMARANSKGVKKIICPASNLSDARKIDQLTRKYREIYGCVGIYPGEAKDSPNWREDLEQIEELLTNNRKLVGIGEIGLDKYWLERDEGIEREVFSTQIEMAVRLDLPIVIHNRLCHEQIKQVFAECGTFPRGVFHCFSGDKEFLDWVIETGFYVGIDGNITYKSNRELRELMKTVPDERLLLETDSPYLPPEGRRGRRNEPENVRITAELVAKERGVSLEELGQQTSENVQRLFGI